MRRRFNFEVKQVAVLQAIELEGVKAYVRDKSDASEDNILKLWRSSSLGLIEVLAACLSLTSFCCSIGYAQASPANRTSTRTTVDRQQFIEYQTSPKRNVPALAKYEAGLRAHETGDNDKAIKLLNEAISIDPNCVQAMHTLGAVYMWEEEYEKSLAVFNQALKIKPDFRHALYRRAFTYASLFRYKDTIADLDKLLKLQPNYDGARKLRAKCQSSLGNFTAAISDYTVMVQADPMGEEERLQRARLYVKAKQPLKAIEDYSFMIKHFPDEYESFTERADQYFALGRFREASSDYNASLMLGTDHAKHCREQRDLCFKKMALEKANKQKSGLEKVGKTSALRAK
ncbi:tetratricopeptide repeat protein [bacterium]|nr:tetratricopeptide repeat protein [bacterium]MBP9806787.1 tetratricopeptide repeat protein [bacterium]